MLDEDRHTCARSLVLCIMSLCTSREMRYSVTHPLIPAYHSWPTAAFRFSHSVLRSGRPALSAAASVTASCWVQARVSHSARVSDPVLGQHWGPAKALRTERSALLKTKPSFSSQSS